MDVKHAGPEPAYPVAVVPSLETLPIIPHEEVLASFAEDGPLGLRRTLGRLRAALPGGIEIDE
jgi:hypothetical protein